MLKQHRNLLLLRNCSTDNGGAITCKGCTIQNTSGSAIFINNSSAQSGGAIYSTSATTISSNNQVMFSGNSTTGGSSSSGGAIYAADTATPVDLKFEGNKELIFSGNSSTTSGGAIYTNKLTIVTGGPTLFTRNSVSSSSSPTGGAICINGTSGGECSLTAELGDLVFDGNTIITTSGSTTTKRNAIDLGTNGKFTKLNAREGYGIYFYDPIANQGGSDALELNKANGSDTYTGQIVFSGERLSASEKAEADNLKSYFKQPIKLDAGSLVLRDGVTLEANKVEQTAGSAVVMDLGTTLQTSTEEIQLTNLEINVASLGGGGVLLPQFLLLQLPLRM